MTYGFWSMLTMNAKQLNDVLGAFYIDQATGCRLAIKLILKYADKYLP